MEVILYKALKLTSPEVRSCALREISTVISQSLHETHDPCHRKCKMPVVLLSEPKHNCYLVKIESLVGALAVNW